MHFVKSITLFIGGWYAETLSTCLTQNHKGQRMPLICSADFVIGRLVAIQEGLTADILMLKVPQDQVPRSDTSPVVAYDIC